MIFKVASSVRRNQAGFVTAVANPNPNPSTFNFNPHSLPQFIIRNFRTYALPQFRILGTPPWVVIQTTSKRQLATK